VRYLPPIRWDHVAAGSVVLDGLGTPRTVQGLAKNTHADIIKIYLEGMPPIVVDPGSYAFPVELDAADAIGTLHAAGLHPVPIEGNAS
jgi:hypothetical protein